MKTAWAALSRFFAAIVNWRFFKPADITARGRSAAGSISVPQSAAGTADTLPPIASAAMWSITSPAMSSSVRGITQPFTGVSPELAAGLPLSASSGWSITLTSPFHISGFAT